MLISKREGVLKSSEGGTEDCSLCTGETRGCQVPLCFASWQY